VETTKESLEKLGKSLGLVPDFEKDVFDVPAGCRRFILRPDLGRNCEIPPPPPPPPYYSHSLFSDCIIDEQEHWSVEFHDAAGNVALLLCVPALLEITTSFRPHYFFPAPLTNA
jgi:hypothetical protein